MTFKDNDMLYEICFRDTISVSLIGYKNLCKSQNPKAEKKISMNPWIYYSLINNHPVLENITEN